jgi:hypothetical protein
MVVSATPPIATPVHGAVGSDRRHPGASRPDKPGAARVVTFIELADITGDRVARDLLDPPPVAIVGERRRHAAAGEANWPVLNGGRIDRISAGREGLS